jgi:predicted DNA-binding ribbon-helix-helix protein
MKSLIAKHSVSIKGHLTSVSLEDAFWQGLQEIAASRGMTMRDLIRIIDSERKRGNLSSAIRLFVLSYYRGQAKRSKAD